MALKDTLKAGPAENSSPDKLMVWRDGLDDETRDAFDAAVRDSRWGHVQLARAITEDGFKVSAPTIRRWRERVAAGEIA